MRLIIAPALCGGGFSLLECGIYRISLTAALIVAGVLAISTGLIGAYLVGSGS